MNFKIKNSILYLTLIFVVFSYGCGMKTAGNYTGKISIGRGYAGTDMLEVSDVNMTIVKTGVDKQYGRWNTHKVKFSENSPLKCELELELEGKSGDANRDRPDGLYSQVVERQNCEITKDDGSKVMARTEKGEFYVATDIDGGEILNGKMMVKSDAGELFTVIVKAPRK